MAQAICFYCDDTSGHHSAVGACEHLACIIQRTQASLSGSMSDTLLQSHRPDAQKLPQSSRGGRIPSNNTHAQKKKDASKNAKTKTSGDPDLTCGTTYHESKDAPGIAATVPFPPSFLPTSGTALLNTATAHTWLDMKWQKHSWLGASRRTEAVFQLWRSRWQKHRTE